MSLRSGVGTGSGVGGAWRFGERGRRERDREDKEGGEGERVCRCVCFVCG